VVRNGVDTQRFQPQPQAQARAALGLDGAPLLLSVGHLVPVKGHDIALQALAQLAPRYPGARLVFVGDGPLRAALQAQAQALGISAQVHFAGAVPNDQLAAWYSAADLLVLASRSEGWANVLLEAMACGTPVVATAVGGTAEVVGRPEVGRVVPPLDPAALAAGIEAMWAAPPDRAAVRTYAQAFGWDETSAAQLRLFRAVLARRRSARRGPPLKAA
jgi:glycosyltransferase involved in cell wall biosynthesis